MASINSINDEFKKRQKNLERIGYPQVQVTPNNGQGPQDINSWGAKYGDTATVFDVASGKVSPRVANTPILQTMGAQAGSSANPVNTNDANNTSQTFSLADAVRMDNLPGGPNAVNGAPTITPSAINQPNGAERGETDNAASRQSQGEPRFGAKNLFEITEGGLGTTQTVNNSVKSPVSYINNAGAENKPIGTEGNGNNNPVSPEGNKNINNAGNPENPKDSSNGRTEEEKQSNPSARQQDQLDLKQIKKENEAAARRRAEEEARRLKAENESSAA